MNRSRSLAAAISSLATAAVLISGCASNGTGTGTGRAASSSTRTSHSVLSYIDSVTRLEKPVEAAAGDFFHSPHAPAAQLRRANALRNAYATGARRLSTMTPPTVGVAAQRTLVNTWSRVARQLAKVTHRRPFSYSRAFGVAEAAEQPTSSAYSAILTLP
jgi:hypothetical protein